MSYTTERRIEEKEQRRTEIIDAAEVVFADRGIEETTLGEVARQARLSRGLIYFYFKDKEDLICAVSQRSLRLLHDRFEAAAEQHETGIDKVAAMGRAYFEFARNYPLYARMITHWGFHETLLEGMSENQAACMLEGNRVFDVMTRAIRAGMTDGTIDPDLGDPMNTAVSLWGFTHGLLQISTQKEAMLQRFHGVNTRELVEHAFRMMQQSLRPKT
jgi:TetR/AcrR family transcriptional regulator